MAGELIFTHFTDAAGLEGITGLTADELLVGETVEIDHIYFGAGLNSFLTSEVGRIFLTGLGPEASALRLALIGIFTAQQQFAIRVSAETLHNNRVAYFCENAQRSIYTIPAHVTIYGAIQVTRRF